MPSKIIGLALSLLYLSLVNIYVTIIIYLFLWLIGNGWFQKKSKQRGKGWGYTFLKKILGTFRFVTLSLKITDKTKLPPPWKFYKIVLQPALGTFKAKKHDHLWKCQFFIIEPCWNFLILFVQYIPEKFQVLNPLPPDPFGFFFLE